MQRICIWNFKRLFIDILSKIVHWGFYLGKWRSLIIMVCLCIAKKI